MKNKIPTVRLVFDRKHQATKSGVKNARKGLVQIEVLYQRKRKYISTGVKLYADQWVQNKEVHVVASAYAQQYNETISHAMRTVLNAINRQGADGDYDIDALVVAPTTSPSVGDYGKGVLEAARLSPSTLKTQLHILKTISAHPAFGSITKVTQADIEDFLNNSKFRDTTKRVYLTVIKRIFRHAFEHGIIDIDPAAKVRRGRGKPRERVRLTDEEIKAIASLELSPSRQIARDIFLFQCYTGLAYIDVKTLTPEMIEHENGRHYIVRARQKTGVRYRTMLLKPAVAIMEKYEWQLPVPVKVVYNYHLGKIEKAAKIGKHISSHVGRHTFATWALSHGTPIEIVSKMLGHTKIETTQIYAKILAKDVDAQFEKLDELFK